MSDKTYDAWEHIRQMIIDLDKLWDVDKDDEDGAGE